MNSWGMVSMKRFKVFDDSLLELHPELKEVLKPNDQYLELKNVQKTRSSHLPIGSFNTKVIINEGEIVERVYKTPKGQVISLFSGSSNILFDKAA
tara:strand:- start:203 stop:487 length:285 start_codon:yes stop_codon:yes gene_type:complete